VRLPPDVGAIVVAAGQGVRFGSATPKQFHAIGGVPIVLRALRAFTTQVHAGSVVQSWLDAPANERFAPMPARDAAIPHLRSYYDEVFRFDEQGIDRGTVDRVLRAALSTS